MTAARRHRRSRAALLPLVLDRDAREPLQRQIYAQVRGAVLNGRLSPGSRLPSSRALASELGCSRNTVVSTFDQLLSEGYLEGHAGSGTFVCRVLPEDLLGLPAAEAGTKAGATSAAGQEPPLRLSARGRDVVGLRRRQHGPERAFMPGIPETEEFPFDIWSRLHSRVWRRPSSDLVRLGSPAGMPTAASPLSTSPVP